MILVLGPVCDLLFCTKGARKAIMLVTINDYWLYQLVPFFVMHSIYLVLRPILTVPKQYSFETVCFKKQGLSASTAGRTRQFAGINHQSRWQGKACLWWPAKNHVNLMEFWLTFYFYIGQSIFIKWSQLCSFNIAMITDNYRCGLLC